MNIFDATFPAIFYETLEKEGWEIDNINTNDVLTYVTNHFTGLGWAITADVTGVFYAELTTHTNLGIFCFKMVYDMEEIPAILQVFIRYQQRDWKNIDKATLNDMFSAFGALSKSRGYFIKHIDKTAEASEIIMNATNIHQILNPTFQSVELIGDFYLAGVLESRIFIAKENIPLAWKKWQEHLKDAPSFATIDEYVKENFFSKPTYDEDGNITNFQQGGDDWIYVELEYIAEFIQSGSYFLIQDDDYQLHRADYLDGKVYYTSEII
jgi:hypothetical protein